MTDHKPSKARQVTTTHSQSGAVVVAAMGEIDVFSGDQLRAALAQALPPVSTSPGQPAAIATERATHQAAGVTTAVLELTEVTFMDSTGLGILVAAQKHANALGLTWRLRGLNRMVRRILDLTGLINHYEIYPD